MTDRQVLGDPVLGPFFLLLYEQIRKALKKKYIFRFPMKMEEVSATRCYSTVSFFGFSQFHYIFGNKNYRVGGRSASYKTLPLQLLFQGTGESKETHYIIATQLVVARLTGQAYPVQNSDGLSCQSVHQYFLSSDFQRIFFLLLSSCISRENETQGGKKLKRFFLL